MVYNKAIIKPEHDQENHGQESYLENKVQYACLVKLKYTYKLTEKERKIGNRTESKNTIESRL